MILFLDSISYPFIVILCIETQGRNKLIFVLQGHHLFIVTPIREILFL